MKIAIIGAGNMGSAIAKGLTLGKKIKAEDISVSDQNEKSLNNIKKFNPKINIFSSNADVVQNADIIIIAVKPWMVATVALEIKDFINYEKQKIVSIAANVDFKQLTSYFCESATMFRVMPNTAIEVLQSVSAIASYNGDAEEEALILNVFNELGKAFIIPESQIDAFMALASCGIAYAFRYVRASTEGAVELGINPNTAQEVILQTLRGAVEILEKHQSHPEAEIDKVTTPGGTTIRGLNEMEAKGFSNAVIKGLKASCVK
jgi:pyrroline-5-carboxylate reductase